MYAVALDGMLFKYLLSIWSNESLKASVSLLSLCLNDLSIDISEDISGIIVDDFPTIIVLLSISPFRSVNIWFIYLGALVLKHKYFQMLEMLYPFVGVTPLSL